MYCKVGNQKEIFFPLKISNSEVIRRKNIKASKTHTAITYSIGRCLMVIPTYI